MLANQAGAALQTLNPYSLVVAAGGGEGARAARQRRPVAGREVHVAEAVARHEPLGQHGRWRQHSRAVGGALQALRPSIWAMRNVLQVSHLGNAAMHLPDHFFCGTAAEPRDSGPWPPRCVLPLAANPEASLQTRCWPWAHREQRQAAPAAAAATSQHRQCLGVGLGRTNCNYCFCLAQHATATQGARAGEAKTGRKLYPLLLQLLKQKHAPGFALPTRP